MMMRAVVVVVVAWMRRVNLPACYMSVLERGGPVQVPRATLYGNAFLGGGWRGGGSESVGPGVCFVLKLIINNKNVVLACLILMLASKVESHQ